MFLWLFHACPLFPQSSRSTTVLLTSDKRNCYCCKYLCVLQRGFEVYTWRYSRMGRYNQELSARWSFGLLYSRGCYFQGGIIIQRLWYMTLSGKTNHFQVLIYWYHVEAGILLYTTVYSDLR